MKFVRRGARCLWRIGIRKRKALRLEKKNDGVMDDQDVADEVSEEVDSRGDMMHAVRLRGIEKFKVKRENFIFNTFIYFKPVKKI